jgi:hypothetical protein
VLYLDPEHQGETEPILSNLRNSFHSRSGQKRHANAIEIGIDTAIINTCYVTLMLRVISNFENHDLNNSE